LAAQNKRISLLNAWAAVLRVGPEDVVLQLGRVADLVRQTQDAVDRAGEDALVPPVQRYRASWSRPIFPEDFAFNAALENVLPDAPALEALGLVSAQLHSIAPEGLVPDDDHLEQLQTQLRDLIDGVQTAEDIPDEVKPLIISRLRAVEEAVQHLDVGGPNAVRRAMEAVMGSLIFAQDARLPKSQTVNRLWTTLLVIWTVFSSGPAVQTSIEAWQQLLPQLESQTSTHSSNRSPRETEDTGETPPAKASER
jgi:hypothetical protein